MNTMNHRFSFDILLSFVVFVMFFHIFFISGEFEECYVWKKF
jgi:hypothetical protein